MRPFHNLIYQAMFDGVEMNIIRMGPKILFVPNNMLPKAALPDAPFMFIRAALATEVLFLGDDVKIPI